MEKSTKIMEKSIKKEQKTFKFNKWALVPVILGAILRYGPHAFYGNTRVYDEAVPLAVIDDFLPESARTNQTRTTFCNSC